MRKAGKTSSLCVQQITNPEIVLVNYVVILDIVLPYIVWTALILKRNIGLPEALKTPIGLREPQTILDRLARDTGLLPDQWTLEPLFPYQSSSRSASMRTCCLF